MAVHAGEPFFLADWIDLTFCHFELAAEALQPLIPFPLDTWQGRAFVSLVSFELNHLRLRKFPRITQALFRPFTRSHFLNVRTYVVNDGEPGIYFLQEYLSNRLSIPFGRPAYGLPYHYAAAERLIEARTGNMKLALNDLRQKQLKLTAAVKTPAPASLCPADSLDEFLLERYTAYTCHQGIKRRFRIWHPPWQQRAMDFQASNEGLLPDTWFPQAQATGGHSAKTAKDVWMGKPTRIT